MWDFKQQETAIQYVNPQKSETQSVNINSMYHTVSVDVLIYSK